MLSDEWLSRYGLLENFNASVTRTGTRTGTGTWTTGVTAIALCTSCSRAKQFLLVPFPPGLFAQKNRMGLFAKKGETIRSKSILWVGSSIVFFFCSGVSRLFGAQGSPSSDSLLSL